MDEDCGREVCSLFCKVFEDTKLREYYEKNFFVGEFSCLVCGAVGGKKTAKKFKGCLPLVQHCMSIEKTKRRRAHRALAQAVCKVLGWDIHNLPKIVSMLSDKSVNAQGNGNGDCKESSVAFVLNVDSVKGDEAAPASDAGKKLEAIGISFMACPDADKTENQVHPRTTAVIASTSASVPIIRHHLQPSAATKFKKKKKKKRKGKVGKKLADSAVTESNSSHGAEWPCPSPPHLPSTSGWPTASWATLEKSTLKPVLLSTEEQLMLAARHAHQHALKVVHKFFRKNNSDDSNEIDSGSDGDDDDELMEEDSGSEEYSFFCKVFEEDKKLRECYMKNFAEGEFNCLVCGAVGGKNSGKKFKGCLPLLQHLITIAKTKKRKAHRAFGRAVCKVLGWDIDRLPTVESMLSDKTSERQISLTCVDANKNLENLGMVYQPSVEKPASQELTINSLLGPDADHNESLGMVHQVEQPASERSNSVPSDEEESRGK
ncbi:hypothetical protein C2S53_003101 [Perilla frutescens var. hirtella]|uniref:Uncharacterized protein n=1 Tax=Perilla frutescens var. hirtella TaxID=608512 RepID=A0AAD4JNV3_PERFH|nr:hypothetical protein C2S53_003101 [Perilla frutescens var. hirtella]